MMGQQFNVVELTYFFRLSLSFGFAHGIQNKNAGW